MERTGSREDSWRRGRGVGAGKSDEGGGVLEKVGAEKGVVGGRVVGGECTNIQVDLNMPVTLFGCGKKKLLQS